MSNRRAFLKSSLAVAAGIAVGQVSPVSAGSVSFPKGVVYTKQNCVCMYVYVCVCMLVCVCVSDPSLLVQSSDLNNLGNVADSSIIVFQDPSNRGQTMRSHFAMREVIFIISYLVCLHKL